MGRNNADFEVGQGMEEFDDSTSEKLASKGIVKNSHGQEIPDHEWMQEPEDDRW